jgi:ribonuclease HII
MVGVDEVGRGCLAGPLLVVAARAVSDLPKDVADSKILNRSQREELFNRLAQCCQFGEGWVTCAEIDGRGLAAAMRLGVARSLRALGAVKTEKIIMDGPVNYVPKVFKDVQCIIDADALIPLVSAASIYAKVKRDLYMISLKERYPQYGFENHVGYYTPSHRLAIQEYGHLNKIHRISFRPLRTMGNA